MVSASRSLRNNSGNLLVGLLLVVLVVVVYYCVKSNREGFLLRYQDPLLPENMRRDIVSNEEMLKTFARAMEEDQAEYRNLRNELQRRFDQADQDTEQAEKLLSSLEKQTEQLNEKIEQIKDKSGQVLEAADKIDDSVSAAILANNRVNSNCNRARAQLNRMYCPQNFCR